MQLKKHGSKAQSGMVVSNACAKISLMQLAAAKISCSVDRQICYLLSLHKSQFMHSKNFPARAMHFDSRSLGAPYESTPFTQIASIPAAI